MPSSTPASAGAGPPQTDLLMLNAGNYPRNVIYPYAFVQVRALARAQGLRVGSFDFLGIAREHYRHTVRRLLARHRPRMIGITLRQADSIVHCEYSNTKWKPYYPVEDTAALLGVLREETDVPIAMGGFGFTTHAGALYDLLKPDLGMQGEPEGLFARFEDVLAGRGLDEVDNLVHRQDGATRLNPRVFHAPHPDREYDDEVVDQLEAFYGRTKLYGDCPPSVAVELARGCIFRCEFCTEPRVKGRTFRVRDLDVVMGEVEFLARRGIRRVFLVCSEINMGNSALAMEMAERFIRLNEQPWSPGLRWHAYHLPRWLSRDEVATLYRSGFAGGWNDFPSFDDRNLVSLRVPYRKDHVLEHLQNTMDLQGPVPFENTPHVSFFIGNAKATPQSVARSVRAFNLTRMPGQVDDVKVFFGTRLFAPEDGGPLEVPPTTVTYTSTGPLDHVDVAHPTFHLAPALAEVLGPDAAAHDEFFDYLTTTLMRSPQVWKRDWNRFLATAAPPAWIAAQLAPHRGHPRPLPELPHHSQAAVHRAAERIVACETGAALRDFLMDESLTDTVRRRTAMILVALASRPLPPRWLELLDHLGLEHDGSGGVPGTPYEVVVALLPRFGDTAELLEAARSLGLADDSKEVWLLRRLIFEKDLLLRPEYRALLIVQEEAGVPGMPIFREEPELVPA
jgi:hypothetical protein